MRIIKISLLIFSFFLDPNHLLLWQGPLLSVIVRILQGFSHGIRCHGCLIRPFFLGPLLLSSSTSLQIGAHLDLHSSMLTISLLLLSFLCKSTPTWIIVHPCRPNRYLSFLWHVLSSTTSPLSSSASSGVLVCAFLCQILPLL